MKIEIEFIDCNKKLPNRKNRIGIIKTLVYCENGNITEGIYCGGNTWIGNHGLQFGNINQMGEGSKVTHWAYQKNIE